MALAAHPELAEVVAAGRLTAEVDPGGGWPEALDAGDAPTVPEPKAYGAGRPGHRPRARIVQAAPLERAVAGMAPARASRPAEAGELRQERQAALVNRLGELGRDRRNT